MAVCGRNAALNYERITERGKERLLRIHSELDGLQREKRQMKEVMEKRDAEERRSRKRNTSLLPFRRAKHIE